jgi:hypothetical protein
MLRHVTLVRTDVSEALSASFIRLTRISEIATTLAVTRDRRTIRNNTKLLTILYFGILLHVTVSFTLKHSLSCKLHKYKKSIKSAISHKYTSSRETRHTTT